MRKKGCLSIVFLCVIFLLMENVTLMAAEKDIIEIPQTYIELEKEDGNLVQPLSSPSLTRCTLEIGIASNGVEVSFVTTANQSANEIGVKNVVLQEKTTFGWTNITIADHYKSSSDIYSGGVVYTGATKGKTYRVYCTHYAKFGSTELTLYNITGELVYN